ncbi:MAG TPA: DUF1194 domain-containing protein [Hyphomicrobiaceae bacterium]|nr:DUF1194 domain-containing protein [Hyphomicrobiaceae bacterium]
MAQRTAAIFCAWLLALVLMLGANPPAAAQTAVDLQLVLAVDVSGSVSDERFKLQMQGYAQAFRNWRILDAIRSGASRSIAVTVTQWTGPGQQAQVVPWMVISDEASMLALADAIERMTRQLYGGGTSISGAIDHAMSLFAESGTKGERQVIDVSGDGANNRGRPAAEARDEAIKHGVTINGLPILALEPGLDEYYQANVIGGPNAFAIAAESYDTFAEAVLRKLISEIAGADHHGPGRTGAAN